MGTIISAAFFVEITKISYNDKLINLMNKLHHNFAWFIFQRMFFVHLFFCFFFLLKLQEVINCMNGWCKCLRSYICCKKYLLIWANLFFLKILQEYSSYDLMRPMPGLIEDEHRCVIHEGPLRLLEKQGKV